MNIEIGDRIRFLNDIGGGIVKKIIDKQMVLVEDETGFDIPVAMKECVVVSRETSQPKPQIQQPKVSIPEPEEEEEKPFVFEETPEGEILNVSLAFLPQDPNKMSETGYESYFINDSNYFLMFTYLQRENNAWHVRFSGKIEPNTKIFIEEFKKEEINSLERICIQLIAFKENKPFLIKNPASVELHLDTVKFYKRHCFIANDFFEEDAWIIPIIENDIPKRELLITATDLTESMTNHNAKPTHAPTQARRKKKQHNPIVEIDLHIHELLDDTSGMSPKDMLDYQLNVFHNTLAEYANKKGQKIVFIHGKGEGVLKQSILKELKHKYKKYEYQDASFQEYGFGATMIIIH